MHEHLGDREIRNQLVEMAGITIGYYDRNRLCGGLGGVSIIEVGPLTPKGGIGFSVLKKDIYTHKNKKHVTGNIGFCSLFYRCGIFDQKILLERQKENHQSLWQ